MKLVIFFAALMICINTVNAVELTNVRTLTMVMKEPNIYAFIDETVTEGVYETRYKERDSSLNVITEFPVSIGQYSKVWLEISKLFTAHNCTVNQYSLSSQLVHTIDLDCEDKIYEIYWTPDHRMVIAAGYVTYVLDEEFNIIHQVETTDLVKVAFISTFDNSLIMVGDTGLIHKVNLTDESLAWIRDLNTSGDVRLECDNAKCADVDAFGNLYVMTSKLDLNDNIATIIKMNRRGDISTYYSYHYTTNFRDLIVGNDNTLYELNNTYNDYKLLKITQNSTTPVFAENGVGYSQYFFNTRRIINAGPYLLTLMRVCVSSLCTEHLERVSNDILFKNGFD